MEKRDILTKILAIVGAVLVWLPLLIPILFSLIALVARHVFRFDYLMPAELFPLALIGGGLLMCAALRTRLYRGLIGWMLGLAVLFLVLTNLLAVVTGLASGETDPAGLPWAMVLGSIILYSLALVVIGVGAALLLRGLFVLPHQLERPSS